MIEKTRLNQTVSATVVIAVLIAATYVHDLLNAFSFYRELHGTRPWYLVESIDKLAVLILCCGVLLVLHPHGWKGLISDLRLNASPLAAFGFAFTASIPMILGFALTRKVGPDLNVPNLLFLALFSPFVEEVHVRGFGFWQLRNLLKWPFWLAMLPQAALSGLGHIEKGADLIQVLGIFLLIFAGAVVFSWLMDQWHSLWIPFFLHVLMNLWWEVFSVSNTVLGGWFPFALQQLTVLLAIGITLYLKRAGKLPVSR